MPDPTDEIPRRKPRFRERRVRSVAVAEFSPTVVTPPPPPVAPKRSVRVHAVRGWGISREAALYVLLLLVGFTIRIWDVGSRAMHGDEAVHAWLAWNLFTGAGYRYDPVYHGPLQFIVTSVLYFLFSPSNTSARLMAVLFGTALCALPYFLRRDIGRWPALLSAALITFSPAFVYVSRLERDDIFTCVFALLMVVAVFGFVRTHRARFLYLGAATAALSLTAMENSYITYFLLGTYLLVVWTSEALAARAPLRRFWQRSGPVNRLYWSHLGPYLIVLAAAFVLTVTVGSTYLVPLVLGAGIVLLVHRQTVLGVAGTGETPFLTALRSVRRIEWLNALTLAGAILVLAFSVFGEDPRGLWDASQPFFNTGGACPGNPYILNPCRKDVIGGLFYWLSQHAVHRGGQPWFYYTLLFGLYQQIAVVFGLAGILWFTRRPTPFTSFLIFWSILSFGIYSWAGEKFPWLMIHPLLPFTLLAATFIVAVLRTTTRVRAAVVALLALLALLEVHGMYEVNYINGANPVEMMVYVQSSPQTPMISDQILRLSHKVTNSNDMAVSIDSEDTWPFAWYLRDMPNVAYPGFPQIMHAPYNQNPVIIVDQDHEAAMAPQLKGKYTVHAYRLRWWFPENYKSLTWSSFAADALNPGYWKVIAQWMLHRRPFGPRGAVWSYFYVKKGLASPY